MKIFKEFKNSALTCSALNFSIPRRSKGFALLEVFIALLVITTMASTLFLSGISVNNYDKRKTTHTRMKYVQKILNQYVATYGRLPCPADSTTSSASETLISGVCDSASFNSGSTLYGALPVDTLGISREYLQDGWGNKITYIVPKDLTHYNSSNRTILYYKSIDGGYQISGVNSNASAYSSTPFANYISTYYNNGNLDVLINNANIYAIISSGDNGFGAYTISGTQNSLTGANATSGELTNIVVASKENNNFYTNQATTGGTGKIDDIVYSSTITDIISNNQSMVYCDASFKPDGTTSLPTPTTVPHYTPSSMVQFSQTCGVCPDTSGTRNYVECLSGGNWGTAYSRACTC